MSNDETTDAKCAAATQALEELFSTPKLSAGVYHRFILVQRASGELMFVQDAFDFSVWQAIAEAFGQHKPRRRMIRICR